MMAKAQGSLTVTHLLYGPQEVDSQGSAIFPFCYFYQEQNCDTTICFFIYFLSSHHFFHVYNFRAHNEAASTQVQLSTAQPLRN